MASATIHVPTTVVPVLNDHTNQPAAMVLTMDVDITRLAMPAFSDKLDDVRLRVFCAGGHSCIMEYQLDYVNRVGQLRDTAGTASLGIGNAPEGSVDDFRYPAVPPGTIPIPGLTTKHSSRASSSVYTQHHRHTSEYASSDSVKLQTYASVEFASNSTSTTTTTTPLRIATIQLPLHTASDYANADIAVREIEGLHGSSIPSGTLSPDDIPTVLYDDKTVHFALYARRDHNKLVSPDTRASGWINQAIGECAISLANLQRLVATRGSTELYMRQNTDRQSDQGRIIVSNVRLVGPGVSKLVSRRNTLGFDATWLDAPHIPTQELYRFADEHEQIRESVIPNWIHEKFSRVDMTVNLGPVYNFPYEHLFVPAMSYAHRGDTAPMNIAVMLPFLTRLVENAVVRIGTSIEMFAKCLDAQRTNAEIMHPDTRIFVEPVIQAMFNFLSTRFPYTADASWRVDTSGNEVLTSTERTGNALATFTEDCEGYADMAYQIFSLLTDHPIWREMDELNKNATAPVSRVMSNLSWFLKTAYVPESMLCLIDSGTSALHSSAWKIRTLDTNAASSSSSMSMEATDHSKAGHAFHRDRCAHMGAHMCLNLVPKHVHYWRIATGKRVAAGRIKTQATTDTQSIAEIDSEYETFTRAIPAFVRDLRIVPCEGTGIVDHRGPIPVTQYTDRSTDVTDKIKRFLDKRAVLTDMFESAAHADALFGGRVEHCNNHYSAIKSGRPRTNRPPAVPYEEPVEYSSFVPFYTYTNLVFSPVYDAVTGKQVSVEKYYIFHTNRSDAATGPTPRNRHNPYVAITAEEYFTLPADYPRASSSVGVESLDKALYVAYLPVVYNRGSATENAKYKAYIDTVVRNQEPNPLLLINDTTNKPYLKTPTPYTVLNPVSGVSYPNATFIFAAIPEISQQVFAAKPCVDPLAPASAAVFQTPVHTLVETLIATGLGTFVPNVAKTEMDIASVLRNKTLIIAPAERIRLVDTFRGEKVLVGTRGLITRTGYTRVLADMTATLAAPEIPANKTILDFFDLLYAQDKNNRIFGALKTQTQTPSYRDPLPGDIDQCLAWIYYKNVDTLASPVITVEYFAETIGKDFVSALGTLMASDTANAVECITFDALVQHVSVENCTTVVPVNPILHVKLYSPP